MSTRFGTMSRPKMICPCCMEDNRLVVLRFNMRLLRYECSVCIFVLNDEDVYRACPTSKL